jgi:hypothetical protein
MTKKCSKCNDEKELSEFNKSKNGKFQKRADCKICQRKAAIARNKITYDSKVKWKRTIKDNFNLTVDDYNLMFENQKGCCLICKKHQTDFKKRLAIDHCHHSGKIRGLLCSSCNTGLGLFKDNIESLHSAIEYLKRKS